MDREPQEFLVPIADNERQPQWNQIQYLEACLLSPAPSPSSDNAGYFLPTFLRNIFGMSLDSPTPPLPLVFFSLAHVLFSGYQYQ